MNPGDLNKRITIQQLATSINDNGFEIESWTDYKIVWASVSNLFGREYFQAAAVNAEQTVKFIIRYFQELDITINEYGPKTTEIFRIKYNNSIYDIKFIDNIKYMNKFMEIKCIGSGLNG